MFPEICSNSFLSSATLLKPCSYWNPVNPGAFLLLSSRKRSSHGPFNPRFAEWLLPALCKFAEMRLITPLSFPLSSFWDSFVLHAGSQKLLSKGAITESGEVR
jgi:hypothetical protein